MSDLPKVSFNQLLSWDRCRFLWKLKYIDKMDTTRKGPALQLGTMGHELLCDWYATGVDHSDSFANKWMSDWSSLRPEEHQAIATAITMFKAYIYEFAPQADRHYTVESLEEHFEVELTTPTGRPYILEGYIDQVRLDQNGHRWVDDYKWTQRFWSPLEIQMDGQLTYYAAALAILGRPVHGTSLTQVNTYPYKDRSKKTVDDLFKRELIYRSPQEQAAVMHEVGLMVDDMLDVRGSNTPDDYRRSLRRDCNRCYFQEPCALGLKGVDPVAFMAMSPAFMPKTNSREAQTLEVFDGDTQHLRI